MSSGVQSWEIIGRHGPVRDWGVVGQPIGPRQSVSQSVMDRPQGRNPHHGLLSEG